LSLGYIIHLIRSREPEFTAGKRLDLRRFASLVVKRAPGGAWAFDVDHNILCHKSGEAEEHGQGARDGEHGLVIEPTDP
jgi:hypothetical protein